ncbi:MAG: NAD-dependent epimerase/dehydratase family protein [Deltaproteobacteria bacterium]|nr:MAG: NAD-dependent epimerase/dehydratase family protein [Deltaproteobacteria bacterium]
MTETKNETALVTGGGGFLGKAIIRRLLDRGTHVKSFARSDYPELREMGVEVIRGDLTRADEVMTAVEGCDVVFHVAAKVGVWGKYEDFHNINVNGTQNIIDACLAHRVSRLVYTSSPSAVFDGTHMEGVDESVPYPAPDKYLTHYPKTKAAAERLVKAAASRELRTAILRPHLIWGPNDPHLVARIIDRASSLRIVGDGQNTIDTVYVDNAADAHILAADALTEKPEISGRAYFITQGEPINAWEMINKILAAGGKPPIQKSISYKAAYRVGAVLEFVYGTLGLKKEPRMTRFVAGELAKSHWFSIDAARNDLGYNPSVSTEEGLRRLKESLQN